MSGIPVGVNTVLIIDDDPDLLPLLADTLHVLTDWIVITAADGAMGLERFYEAPPQCVVVDVKMPEIDGFQFMRAVRGDPSSQGIPIVVLTALPQDKDRFVGLASGADKYLVKPVDPVDLIAAIRSAIQMSASERDRRMRILADTLFEPEDS